MTDPLQKLLGSAARVKLLRLFLFNPKNAYTVPDAANRARVPERTARAEVRVFEAAGMVKRARGRSGGARFELRPDFEYANSLQALLLNSDARRAQLVPALRATGVIKLIIAAGVYVGDFDGRLDLLLVGDRVDDRKLRGKIRALEAELGTELRYALLSTPDFAYRLNMGDRLVRDVLDYPHAIVLDKLRVGLK